MLSVKSILSNFTQLLNVPGTIFLMVDGNLISLNWHPLKTPPLISSFPSWNVTLFRFVHPLKFSDISIFKSFGIVTSEMFVFLKALEPISFIESGKFISFKLLAPSKAYSPIVVKSPCIITVSSFLLLQKAYAPISFTLGGIIIFFNPSNPENAPYPIFVTFAGIVSVPVLSINNKFPFEDINSPFSISYGLTSIFNPLAHSISLDSCVLYTSFPFITSILSIYLFSILFIISLMLFSEVLFLVLYSKLFSLAFNVSSRKFILSISLLCLYNSNCSL